jgi:hypothetical protein
MGLDNLIAYGVVFGVPLWLVTEELLHRVGPRLMAAAARVRFSRAPKRARVHAHIASC